MFFFTINYPCPEISLLHHQIISFSSFEPDNQFTQPAGRGVFDLLLHIADRVSTRPESATDPQSVNHGRKVAYQRDACI